MKEILRTGILVSALLGVPAGFVAAQATRSTPAIEQLYDEAVAAIGDERYIQATQLLTRLVGLPEHVHSQEAQELLGNVREANGQLAHAVAEYEIYLEKYPEGAGAERVSARLSAILSGATPVPQQPDVAAVEARGPAPARPRIIPPRGPSVRSRPSPYGDGEAVDPSVMTVTNRGSVNLVYRYNEGATEITELNPDPIPDVTEEEDGVFNNAVIATLRYQRIMENSSRKITLSFSGGVEIDFEDSDDNDLRLYELSAALEDKASGRVLTFGRQRLKPSGVAYRLDGVSVRWPSDGGIEYGLFAGTAVDSTRDDFFGDDRVLVGVSATLPEGAVGPGALSGYFVEQRDGSFTDRRALGVEYDLNLENGGVFANAEVDLKFGELNRALVTGTRVLANDARVTGRLAYYRSPRLSLQNALIGQSAGSLSELNTTITESQIEDLALDRSAKVTTLGLTYYGPLTEQWDISAFGSLYHTSGTPASTGIAGADDVAAVAGEGVRSYAGVQVLGSSVFRDRDQVSFGLRHSHSDDSDLFVADSSMRFPVSEELTVQPRVRVGYRDFDDGGNERFLIPSVNARYKLDRRSSLQVDLGGRWSKETQATTITRRNELFLTAGVSRSF